MDINSLLDSRRSASPPRRRSVGSAGSTAGSHSRTSGYAAPTYAPSAEQHTPLSLPAISPNIVPHHQPFPSLQPALPGQYLPPMKSEIVDQHQASGYRPLYTPQGQPVHPGYAQGSTGLVSPPPHYASIKRAPSQTPLGEEPAQKKTTKWTQEEDEMTVELRGAGMKWEDISKRIPGRSAISCRLRYQNYLEKRAHWDEEKKNKLARLYVRFKEQMWQRIASEMGVPWRSAEAMHWQLGPDEIAQRANQPIFQLSASATSTSPSSERPPIPPGGPGYASGPPAPGPPPGAYGSIPTPPSPQYVTTSQHLGPIPGGPEPSLGAPTERGIGGEMTRRRADSSGSGPMPVSGPGFATGSPLPAPPGQHSHTMPMSDHPSNHRLYPIIHAHSNAVSRSDVDDSRSRSSMEGSTTGTGGPAIRHEGLNPFRRSVSRSGEDDSRRSRASKGSPRSTTSEKSARSARSGKSWTGAKAEDALSRDASPRERGNEEPRDGRPSGLDGRPPLA